MNVIDLSCEQKETEVLLSRREVLDELSELLTAYHERWIAFHDREFIILETMLRSIDLLCRHLVKISKNEERCILITSLAHNMMDHLALHIFSTVRILWDILVPEVIPITCFIPGDQFLCSPLHLCSPLTPLDLVKSFIDKGVPIDCLDAYGLTPLMRFTVKHYILQYGPDPSYNVYVEEFFINKLYTTATFDAKVLIREKEVIHYPQTVDIDKSFQHIFSHISNQEVAYSKDIDYKMTADTYYFCKLLLDNNANPNFTKFKETAVDNIHPSVLSTAISNCDMNTVQLLLDYGANPYFISRVPMKCTQDMIIYFDCTMLLLACIGERCDLLNLLDCTDYEKFDHQKGTLKIINKDGTTTTWDNFYLYDYIQILLPYGDVIAFTKLIKHRSLWSLALFFGVCRRIDYCYAQIMLQEDKDLARRPLFIDKKLVSISSEVCMIPINEIKSKYREYVALLKLLIDYGADFTSTVYVNGNVVNPVDYIVSVIDKNLGCSCSLFLRLKVERPLVPPKPAKLQLMKFVHRLEDNENIQPKIKSLKKLAVGYLQKQFTINKPNTQQIECIDYLFKHAN